MVYIWYNIGMEFIVLSSKLKEKYKNQIFDMLKASDKEFVPPLSFRVSTTQSDLKGSLSEKGIKSYFDTLLTQEVLGIFIDKKLAGVISFILDYKNQEIHNLDSNNVYLSTLVVSSEFRGQGITKKAYDYLFNTLYLSRSIYTRTWSTNYAHIKILNEFNFSLILNKPNDRGNGIDTVYFELKR